MPGTHGVHEATTDADLIRAWWSANPNANIALACGAASGIYVVDIDVDEARGVNGFRSLDEAGIELPATWTVETPRGGRHYYYKCEGTPPRNKNNFKTGVDIRGDGYYVMAPPSVHPNGGVYAWGDGDAEIAEFPESCKPAAPVVAPAPWRAATAPQRTDNVTERAIRYLETMDAAVQGQGGHNALIRAADAMAVGFALDDATALDLLWTYYNPRCIPPWDRTKAGDVRDFERKVGEARRTTRQQPGYLRDVENPEVSILDERGERLAMSLLDGEKSKETPPPAPAPAAEECEDFPIEILNPPGLVGDVARWINETSGCPQPGLAVAASLAACGALFSRKVRDESDGRTNVFVFSVAHSSAGKDWGAKAICKLFNAAGGEQFLAGTVTSDAAIEKSLESFPIKLFVIDEVGHFMSQVNKAGADNAAYLKTIKPTLMKLYSSAKDWYIGKTKADGEVRRLEQPSVCVYGMTSPDVLYGSLTREELRDGWLARVICFTSSARPRYRMTRVSPLPAALVEQFRAWISRVIPPAPDSGDIGGTMSVNLLTIPTTPEARAIFEQFGNECYDNMIAASGKGDDIEFLWGKGLENARRVALIVACGENFDGAIIDEQEARYGVAVARHNIKSFEKAIERNLAETTWQRTKQRILHIIENCGPDGIGKRQLVRKSQWCKDKRERDMYLQDLIDADLVIVGRHESQRAEKSCWLWSTRYPARGIVLETTPEEKQDE